MKNIALISTSVILGILTLMIVMTVYGRMNRSMELKSNLASAIEETVENMALKNIYSIHNTDEFLADMAAALAVSLDTQSDITVDILQCEKEKGILSVKVTASYFHPNGKMGTVGCERTVILNRQQKAEIPEQYRVKFYVGTDLYKEYTVWEKDVICAPAEPQNVESVFCGWIDEEGYLADFSEPVTQDRVYYADMV